MPNPSPRIDIVTHIDIAVASHRSLIAELLRARALLVAPTPLDVAIQKLYAQIATDLKAYDIAVEWGFAKGTLEANTAETALDIVTQELTEKGVP